MRVRAQSFEEQGKDGTIPQGLGYQGPNFGVADIHTLVWCDEWGLMKNTRDDARWGGMTRPDPDIPELALHNKLDFDDPDAPRDVPPRYQSECNADVHQKLLFSDRREALLIDGAVDIQNRPSEDFGHTVYTIWNPEISYLRSSEAFLESRNGYDMVVATADDEPYIAYVQSYQTADGRLSTTFDGQRIGDGETDKSAWTDIYEEADGWIDSNEQNERSEREVDQAKLDVGVGRHVGTNYDIRWTAAFGFGDSWTAAADAAIDTVEADYESERSAWI